jgi:ATP-binding cassette, subfamily B, bacterial
MSLLRAAGFLMSLAARVDRARLIRAATMMITGYLAAPLVSVALARFTDDVLARRTGPALTLAVVIALLLVAQLMLSHFAHLDYYELAEMQESGLRIELMELVNHPATIEHLDDPAFADNVGLVREALFSNMFGRRAQTLLERARERSAEQVRLHRHLLELATSASSVKEVRIFGAEGEVTRRQDAAWNEITVAVCRGQAAAAALRSVGQLIFAAAYGAAILVVLRQAAAGHATVGDLVLVITLAVQVSGQITGALQLMSFLQSAEMTIARIKAMRRASGTAPPSPRALPPPVLRRGIALENISFSYAGSATPVLHDICLDIPAGHTVALVGENGAGKSTLIKLLCGMYTPTAGRIVIDGVDLTELDPAQWRDRVGALFQDFCHFEFTLREGVGLGDVGHLDDAPGVLGAITSAGAENLLRTVPGGLGGLIGRGYGDGAELSGGQWQTVGLARCLMRDHPQLLMADTIAVLDGGHLVETGTHAELMALGGLYAELFRLQAGAYH